MFSARHASHSHLLFVASSREAVERQSVLSRADPSHRASPQAGARTRHEASAWQVLQKREHDPLNRRRPWGAPQSFAVTDAKDKPVRVGRPLTMAFPPRQPIGTGTSSRFSELQAVAKDVPNCSVAAAASYQGLPLGCPRGFHKRFVRKTVEPLPAAAVHRSICQEDLAGQSSPVGCQAGRADEKPVKTAVLELFAGS